MQATGSREFTAGFPLRIGGSRAIGNFSAAAERDFPRIEPGANGRNRLKLSIVVAMAENRVIGRGNRLPWHLPADLQHFKSLTMGKPVLMGRKTHDSIGRALPGRHNVVVTRQPGYTAKGCTVVSSIDSALAACPNADEIMVIGGAELYRELLPLSETIYLTLVHGDFEGDTFFPEIAPAEWRETARVERSADDKNPHPYSFVVMQRRPASQRGTPQG